MKRSSTLAVLIGIASGCSGGSDGAFLPGQVDADGPSAVPPPTAAGGPTGVGSRPPPPGDQGPAEGCPSVRNDEPATVLDVAAVRLQLVGIYRTCTLGSAGIELRLDPDSDTRLRWWPLDERFIRTSTAGTVDIVGCESGTCDLEWQDQLSSQPTSRSIRIWSEPTALQMMQQGYTVDEWLRIAD